MYLQPSKINLPQTATNQPYANSCCFINVGGMKDIIDSDKNGYLVKAFNEKDYLNSVIKLLNSDDNKKKN